MLLATLDNQPGPARDIVTLNAGAALYTANLTDSIEQGIARARDIIASGAARAKLDEFVRRSQQVMHQFGGNVLQLTLGDKGAYLYGVFGSPIAHEDDAARAAAAALDLVALEGTTAAPGATTSSRCP